MGTGRYCRSSKYHDKAVDAVHPTGNGYLVTASTGSRFIKVWRLNKRGRRSGVEGEESLSFDPVSSADVTELQILREHPKYLTAFCAGGGGDEAGSPSTLVSASSEGGRVLLHTFPSGVPHYEMASLEEDGAAATAAAAFVSGGGGLVEAPEKPTEVCQGPRLCKVGKTGLVRSSSSFQVYQGNFFCSIAGKTTSV